MFERLVDFLFRPVSARVREGGFFGAILGAVAGPIIGGLISGDQQSSAAQSAAGAQTQASDAAIAEQRRQYDLTRADALKQYETTRADQQPYRGAGTGALAKLTAGLSGGVEGVARDILSAFPTWSATGTPGNPGTPQQIVDSFVKMAPQIFGDGNQQVQDILARAGPASGVPDFTKSLAPEFNKKFTAADLQADPVYQSGLKFGLDQGTGAINARAIAAGGYDSGATLKALTRFANDYGSQKAGDSYNRFTADQSNFYNRARADQGDIYNRLAGISGTGQTATNNLQQAGQAATGQIANAGQNSTNNISEALLGAGNARAAGIVGSANAYNGLYGGVNNALQGYQNNQTLQALMRGGNNNSQFYGGSGGNYGAFSPYYTGYDSSGGPAYG